MLKDERDENKDHDNRIRLHGMCGRGNFDFIENMVGPQVTLKKTYKVDASPVEINVDTEEGNERNERKLCMINRDEKKHNNRNKKFHDNSVDSITVSCGTVVN